MSCINTTIYIVLRVNLVVSYKCTCNIVSFYFSCRNCCIFYTTCKYCLILFFLCSIKKLCLVTVKIACLNWWPCCVGCLSTVYICITKDTYCSWVCRYVAWCEDNITAAGGCVASYIIVCADCLYNVINFYFNISFFDGRKGKRLRSVSVSCIIYESCCHLFVYVKYVGRSKLFLYLSFFFNSLLWYYFSNFWIICKFSPSQYTSFFK